MSITDELRGFASNWDWLDRGSGATERKILTIADRIDAEHKREIDHACKQYDNAVAERGWIRLPKDANGEYIHIGDVMENIYGNVDVVEGILSDRYLVLRDNDWISLRADWSHHHHKPTLEDVLAEFALEIDPSADIAVTGAETIKKFAAKLQLKEPGE